MFATIVVPRRAVDVTVDVDVGWSILGSIPCNRAVKQVPGGVNFTSGLVSEGI